jgi:hypothetical protein
MTGNDNNAQPTTSLVRVFRATGSGAVYAIIVFLIRFFLGAIRVLLVAPRLGETMAVIIEAPIMLAASWFVCRGCVDRLNVARTVPAGSLMGLVAFLVLMSAEFGLGCGSRSIASGSGCDVRITGWSDRTCRSGDLRYLPGHPDLAGCGKSRSVVLPAQFVAFCTFVTR